MKISIEDGSEIEKTNLAYQIAKILKPNHRRIVQVIPLITNRGGKILVDNELERKKRNVPRFIEIENNVEGLTKEDLVIFDGCIDFPSEAKTEILTILSSEQQNLRVQTEVLQANIDKLKRIVSDVTK